MIHELESTATMTIAQNDGDGWEASDDEAGEEKTDEEEAGTSEAGEMSDEEV